MWKWNTDGALIQGAAFAPCLPEFPKLALFAANPRPPFLQFSIDSHKSLVYLR